MNGGEKNRKKKPIAIIVIRAYYRFPIFHPTQPL